MNRMRSPDRRTGHRAGRNFENELSLTYLSPGAFTILSAHEYGQSPDPPTAPSPYRLTPTSTRRRTPQAFSIIAEASSNPGTRSPSPTGRVSPFRGRGFNPIGSRHASPNPSPPPQESRTSSSTSRLHQSPKKSQIPQPARRNSGVFQTGKVTSTTSPKFRRKNGAKLSPHLSKSLTNLSTKNASGRPPSNPQSAQKKYSKKPAFEQLSPISGSSPENNNNKSQSSPSKIPRSSRSQPASRKASPARAPHSSIHSSKQNSRPGSKNTSRDPSPSKSQTRIPIKNSYKDVSAKVNSFSKTNKPKVPQKPQDIKSATNEKSRTGKGNLSRKRSIGKIQPVGIDEPSTSNAHSSSNVNAIRENTNEDEDDKNDNNSNSKHVESTKNENGNKKIQSNSKSKIKEEVKNNTYDTTKIKEDNANDNGTGGNVDVHRTESSSKLTDLPTATTVVSSTTTTAAQPLKIDTNIEDILKEELSKQAFSNDDRTLSATSVSNAMNKMNDTVLNSQTLLKDHSFSKLSPAASAIISLSNESNKGNRALDTKSATTALPTIESIHKRLDDGGQNINNSFSNSNKVHMESIENTVKNNINKTLTPDHNNFSGSYIQKSANEKLREARTMVAADVKPIKILVKEKPSEIEVQSGNIRQSSNITNGLNVTPSLPPSQNQDNEVHSEQEQEETSTSKLNCCSRLLARCKCKRCKRKPKQTHEESPSEKIGCFGCRRKRQEAKEEVSSKTKLTDKEATNNKRFWDRLICCKSKKVGDSSCCPSRERKDSWVDKDDQRTKKATTCKDKCKNALKCIFCSACCCKKKVEEDPISRRESMMSKKKSLTPTAVPPVDTLPKIDISLVEHNSLMRGAIPILSVSLAWVCLICNVFLPGTGTVLSGLLCLCLGKPRFSQNDGPRPRLGAFLIDLIIGCGQLFTVCFCLVGWGWSIWWGVIMLKIARKQERIRLAEERALGQIPVVNENHHSRDPERGS